MRDERSLAARAWKICVKRANDAKVRIVVIMLRIMRALFKQRANCARVNRTSFAFDRKKSAVAALRACGY